MSTHIKVIVFFSFGLLAVFGWHFATVLGVLGSAPQTQGEFFFRVGGILIGSLVMSAVTFLLIARKDECAAMPDEREEKVELKSDRVGLIVLYIGLLVVTWFVFTPMEPMQVANAILAVVCLSELIKVIYGLYIYRNGV